MKPSHTGPPYLLSPITTPTRTYPAVIIIIIGMKATINFTFFTEKP